MPERLVATNGVELCAETVGDPGAPHVLLVMGMGLQLVWWKDDLVAQLVGRGFRVTRYDHRDVGRSTPFDGPIPGPVGFLTRRARTTYTLEDLADDAAGLIEPDDRAHVVGVSLGAFVAQQLAIRHPGRVASLVSVMGRPGDGRTGKVAWRMRPSFFLGGDLVTTFRRIGSEDRTEQDDQDVRDCERRSLRRERGDGRGGGRQLAAVLAERDRTPGLRRLTIPATVVHGTRDRVVLPSGGRATAAAIPGAELLEVDRMGHDLARWTWPVLLDAVERTASRA